MESGITFFPKKSNASRNEARINIIVACYKGKPECSNVHGTGLPTYLSICSYAISPEVTI
jgi:hypothetical protein